MRQPEAAETDEAMAWMGMATTQEQMPGMATEAQLRELAGASGEAADELFISVSTVKGHMSAIQAKLGLRNRVEVAAWAWEHGLMD